MKYRDFRGLATGICIVLTLLALWGCSGVPAASQEQNALLDLPISIAEPDADYSNDALINSGNASSIPAEADSQIEQEAIKAAVIARGVHLRATPHMGTKSLGKVQKGEALRVSEIREDGWCRVVTEGGVEGYVWAPLLSIEGRKFRTARYKGMRHILVSSNYYLGPDGVKRSRLEVRGLDFIRPLKHVRLTSRYGIRKKHPVNGGRNKMHQGVDLKARVGTPVRAAASGIVKSIKRGANYGLYVDIKHKLGFTTRYAHLSRASVRKGQRVKAGQLIAKSGNTGATTGPHLHFEIHKRGRAINPLRYITARR